MLNRSILKILAAIILASLPHLSIVGAYAFSNHGGEGTTALQESALVKVRASRIRRGINLSHWFAQSPGNDYSKTHLETHTTAEDIALIKSMGFDHVRFTVEPAPLFNSSDSSQLNSDYLKYFDSALDMILAKDLVVIVDLHPADEFKVRLSRDDRHVENFAKFWHALATHLSHRDAERVILEVINEPMVEDQFRWYGIQARLIAAMRAGAPDHTIIAAGHRWSGLWEMLALEPYSDNNIIYNFHFYEPFAFTHQGASWAGPNLLFYRNIPYPSTPEVIAPILDSVIDYPARLNLVRYGEDRWNAERIDREIGVAAAWAAKHNVPVTCNEFGTYRRFSDPAARARWIADMRAALEKHGIGWAMWDYSGGFSVVNKKVGKATPDEETVKALGLGRSLVKQ